MKRDQIVCRCTDKSVGEVSDFIKKSGVSTVKELVEKMDIGNRCESCLTKGFKNDGLSLSKVLHETKSGRF